MSICQEWGGLLKLHVTDKTKHIILKFFGLITAVAGVVYFSYEMGVF